MTVIATSPSNRTANTADAVALIVTKRLTAARRRRLPDAVSGAVGSGSDGSRSNVADGMAHRASARCTSKRDAILLASRLVANPITSRISAR